MLFRNFNLTLNAGNWNYDRWGGGGGYLEEKALRWYRCRAMGVDGSRNNNASQVKFVDY
jgi:hypothetical protein